MDKKKLLATGLMQLLRLAISSNVLNEIRLVVLAHFDSTLSGEEKKRAVTAHMNALTGDLGVIVQGMGGWLLSTAIDIVHGYLATRES